jgi:threonine/homoserine/homoserine lactone efflux protein
MNFLLFWKSLGIGMAVAAPVGPMGLLCIHRTLDRGQLAGMVFGAGVAAGDLTYAAIAAFGLSAVTSLLVAGTLWIKLVGSLILVVYGLRVALARPDPGTARRRLPGGQAFLAAYGLTLTNPPTILFFAGIFASVATMGTKSQSIVFAAGVFTGSMLWWLILTTIVSRSASLFRPPVMLWINRVSGAVLICFAAYGLATLD